MNNLQERVQNALTNDPRTRDNTIEVLNENGVITLGGTVARSKTSEIAESIVNDIDGVVLVVNEIQVKNPDNDDYPFIISGMPGKDMISK